MDEVERIFAPALAASGAGRPEGAAPASPSPVAGEPNPAVPTAAEAGGADEGRVRTPSMSAMAEFVMRHMRINYGARQASGVDARLLYCLQAQTCAYDARQVAYLESVGIGRRVYAPVTAAKVRAVYSMLMEILQYGSEIPFDVLPTPDPDVPAEVEAAVLEELRAFLAARLGEAGEAGPAAEAELRGLLAKMAEASWERVSGAKDEFARRRAKRLRRKVWDLMVQGGYERAQAKCLEDFCVYGTAVMVGPVVRNAVRNESSVDRRSGVRKIRRAIRAVPCFERVSPVDCYPSPDAEEVTDGVLCVRVRYTREELWRFRRASADGRKARGEAGWRDTAIAKLLSENEFGCRLDEFPCDSRFSRAEGKDGDDVRTCRFEGVRCFAYVDGRRLVQLGITRTQDGDAVEADGFYYTETVVLGGVVAFCRIYDERVGSPLSKSVFYGVPGSWWGESIADKLYSVQSVMNNAVVSLLRNMGPASSSMMWIRDVSRLVDKSPSALQAEPGKVFAFGSSMAGQQPTQGVPMGVLQIPSNASELLSVAKWAEQKADIDSGIPAFSEGTGGSNGGALRTAAGLASFTENATRGVKALARHYDAGIICGPARLMADWVLVYDDDMDLKGDVEVRPVGIMGKILQAQNDQRRLQLLNLALNSQLMQRLLGAKGVLALFRPSLKETNVSPDDVMPPQERLEFVEAVERARQVGEAAAAQAAGAAARQGPEGGGEGAGMMPGVAPVGGGGAVAERRAVA